MRRVRHERAPGAAASRRAAAPADCDGGYDEGNPGGGAACSTGLPGICAAGTSTCQNGTLVCVQNQQPVSEICGNGLDDDCDGQVDDGCPGGGCAHDTCATGAALISGCEPCVSQICAADPWCGNNDWDDLCVQEMRTVRGSLKCPESQGNCSHSLCGTGSALVSGCDAAQSSCVSQICAADPVAATSTGMASA